MNNSWQEAYLIDGPRDFMGRFDLGIKKVSGNQIRVRYDDDDSEMIEFQWHRYIPGRTCFKTLEEAKQATLDIVKNREAVLVRQLAEIKELTLNSAKVYELTPYINGISSWKECVQESPTELFEDFEL